MKDLNNQTNTPLEDELILKLYQGEAHTTPPETLLRTIQAKALHNLSKPGLKIFIPRAWVVGLSFMGLVGIALGIFHWNKPDLEYEIVSPLKKGGKPLFNPFQPKNNNDFVSPAVSSSFLNDEESLGNLSAPPPLPPPGDAETLFLQAMQLQMDGNFQLAGNLYRMTWMKNPEGRRQQDVLFNWALCLKQTNRIRQASERLKLLQKINPDYPGLNEAMRE